MIKQDILEKQVKFSYLAIGSNLGSRKTNIDKAKKLLTKSNIFINDTSSYYETPSWPNKKFPKFLNVVIKIKTQMSLTNLFKSAKKIEEQLGRRNTLKNYPRICDIDIIDYQGKYLKTQFNCHDIVTPHPRMLTRNFVIFPLYEVNKSWIHPKTKEDLYTIISKFRDVDFSDIRIV